MARGGRQRTAVPNTSLSASRKRLRTSGENSTLESTPEKTPSSSPATTPTSSTTDDPLRTLRDVILDSRSGELSKSARVRKELVQEKHRLRRARMKELLLKRRKNSGDSGEEEEEKEERLEEGEDKEEEVVEQEPSTKLAPQVRVINGQIVLDHSSLTFAAPNPEDRGLLLDVVDEENTYTTSASHRKKISTRKWKEEDTVKFYESLSKYGTDFSLISQLFPDRTRRHIRNKFKLEERLHTAKVDAALINRKPIDLADFDLPEEVPEQGNKAYKDSHSAAASEVLKSADKELEIVEEGPIPVAGSALQPDAEEIVEDLSVNVIGPCH